MLTQHKNVIVSSHHSVYSKENASKLLLDNKSYRRPVTARIKPLSKSVGQNLRKKDMDALKTGSKLDMFIRGLASEHNKPVRKQSSAVLTLNSRDLLITSVLVFHLSSCQGSYDIGFLEGSLRSKTKS